MKRILSLVLCLVFALTALAGCKDTHTHTFASEWSSDAENHWHAASCEHTSEKSDLAAHTGTEDGTCDVCGFVTAYTVKVNAPENVTVEGTLSGAPGSDVTFKASVDSKYALSISGAETVGEPEIKDSKAIYTVKVAAIKANTTVEIAANKVVFGEEIATGEGSIDAEKMWVTYYSEVTVNVPSAGKYAIFSTDDSSVNFGENTEDNLWSFDQVYMFEATEAGEIKIKASVWPQTSPEDGVVPFEYTVVAYEDVVLVGTKGTYTLPAGVVMNVTFKAPVAGLYQITSDAEELAWNDTLDTSVTVGATEDGAEVSFTVQCQNLSESTYKFDYELISFNKNEVKEGENKHTFTYGEFFTAEFTAPKAGAYSIVADSEDIYFYQWSTEYNYMAGVWGDFVTKNLEEGEKFCFYIKASNFEATEETVDSTVTITYSGYLVESETSTYTAKAGAEGTLNVFNGAWEGALFVIKAPEGFEVSVDNGTTWAREAQITATSGSIPFLLRGASDTADVVIEEFENKIELSIGETTVTLSPDVTYNVYVDGYTSNAMWKTIIMSWNNENVSCFSGWSEINSGDVIDYIMAGSAVANITFTGTADATVTFIVEDITSDEEGGDIGGGDIGGGEDIPAGTELNLGENSINVVNSFMGVNVTFTAIEAGTYTISEAENETNASCGVEDAFGFSSFDLPYEITLGAGESFSFILMTENYEPDTIDLVITKA